MGHPANQAPRLTSRTATGRRQAPPRRLARTEEFGVADVPIGGEKAASATPWRHVVAPLPSVVEAIKSAGAGSAQLVYPACWDDTPALAVVSFDTF